MLRSAAFAMAVCLGTFAAAQDAPPAPPPPAPPPSLPPGGGGDMPDARGGGEAGAPGVPTPVPELLARTPAVARLSSLIGAEILDPSSVKIGRLDDFVARDDGRLVAIVARQDGQLVGLPLDELIARAKPDLEGGSERVTIRSFKLAPVSRRLESAPETDDKSALDEAWLARLDEGTPPTIEKPEPKPEDADAAEPGATDPTAGEPASDPAEPAADGDATAATPAPAAPPLPVLSALLGGTAHDPAGQPVGTLVDVVVGISKSRIAYLLIQQPEAPDGQGALHAVPYEALVRGAAEGIHLSIGARELALTPRIDGLSQLPVDPLAKTDTPPG